MTPRQAYLLPTIASPLRLRDLWTYGYNHMPEFQPNELDHAALEAQGILTIRVYGYQQYDERRWWALWSACFNSVPFMLLQNAGREGDDFEGRFVTDPVGYVDAATLVGTYRVLPELSFVEKSGLLDVEGVEKFYGDYLRPTTNEY